MLMIADGLDDTDIVSLAGTMLMIDDGLADAEHDELGDDEGLNDTPPLAGTMLMIADGLADAEWLGLWLGEAV
jgi:hypothetical protein